MQKKGLRILLLAGVVATVFVIYGLQLYQLQIVQGVSYRQELGGGTTKEQVIEAARGEILDRNGKPLGINTTGYNVVLDQVYLSDEDQNRIILTLCRLLAAEGEEWIDNLPITKTLPLRFLEDSAGSGSTNYAAQVLRLKEDAQVAAYASVDDVIYNLVRRYDLEEFSVSDQRIIMGVRYEMERRGFSASTPYTFAENVSIETVAKVKERSFELQGADIEESSIRQYVTGSIMPHIVGYIGPIYREEYQQLKEKNEELKKYNKEYALNDTIGKSGVELAYESTLRGSDGIRRITLDASGNVIDSQTVVEPIPGNSVILTIDSDLQRVAQTALEEQIAHLQATSPEGMGREADAGAAVVIHCKTGEILAAATYPSYDMETFRSAYSTLLSDERRPLVNRAYQGSYAAGSCYKPAVALAALSEEIITPSTLIECTGIYTRFSGYQPKCLYVNGHIDVMDALKVSCNYFFYEVGYQLGIDRINRYSSQLGLGQPTGIELPEVIGELSSPEVKARHESDPWWDGDTVQSAIGQLYNNFSPLQLANYTATIANRGTRMEAHIIKSVKSYNLDETISVTQPKIAEQVDAPAEAFETVIEGMTRVTSDPDGGTAYYYLGDYPISIAAKTGTPQTRQYPNSVFVCFAPVDEPEIAVCVVIEDGWHGYTGAPVARAIFNQYFFPDGNTDASDSVSSSSSESGTNAESDTGVSAEE